MEGLQDCIAKHQCSRGFSPYDGVADRAFLMKRPDPMIAGKPGAEDVPVMRARTLWLEELFFLDGRDMLSHPQHGLFTGLALKYQNLQSTDGY